MGFAVRSGVASRVSVGLALCLPALVIVPSTAMGDGATVPGAAASGVRYDPENVTGISPFTETLVKAIEHYAKKEYTAAIDLSKKAIQMNPKNALGPYILGEIYLSQGNMGEAEAAFVQAQEVADAKNPGLRARVLFATADLYERQKKWDKARAAWQSLADFAGKNDAGATTNVLAASAASRIKMIEKEQELQKTYVVVRERIAAEKADAGKK